MAQPTLLTQPFAANGDKNIIPNTTTTQGAFSQDKGFPAECSLPLGAGGVAPSRQDFNGAFNMLSSLMYYTQKGYTWHWDAGQEYFVDCVVVDDTDGKMYRCINNVAAGGNAPSTDATNWETFSLGGGGKTIGEIVWRSVTDPEVEGEFLADGAEISRTMYPDLNTLYAAAGYPWGDGDGTTTFNLPNLIGKFAEGANIAGGYHEAGLPNITGTFTSVDDTQSTGSNTLITSKTDVNSNVYAQSTGALQRFFATQYTFDASLSNPIYGNSPTVQPPSALLIPYVVVFTDATADSALVDMTQIAQDLANKANRDLTNLTQETNDKLKAMALPSTTTINTGITASRQTFTAPANGYVFATGYTTSSSGNSLALWTFDSTHTSLVLETISGYYNTGINVYDYIPIQKGQVFELYCVNLNNIEVSFVYAEGEV